ncbi:MAG: YihA family ribosome biogenesis GTP-binding protein [Candidatus Hydrogenedentes bacterium]|nr:YihA family ribosome biogenesis GTP-binding protein [Candidatus Hydrogenedentota bacterium]
MKIPPARYVKSAMLPSQFPKDRRPEIAFVGRSNVGKSSLLNALLQRKELAKTSSTPGKTQTINFFEIGGKFYFVDLPGYGFAKVPVDVKEAWGRLMTGYLSSREPLRLVIVLLDLRHPPTDKDVEMLELIEEAQKPTVLVATKSDKLTRAQRTENLQILRTRLALDDDALVIPFSAVTGDGKKELWDVINGCV